MICCIAGITIVMGSDTSLSYGAAVCVSLRRIPPWGCAKLLTDFKIVGYLSSGLAFTTLAVNSLVYQPEASKQAAAAGFILLSMVVVSFHISFGFVS